MQSLATVMSMLLSGPDLDGWITLAGRWEMRNGILACTAAPASIRSTFESDEFVLSFQCRGMGPRGVQFFVHSKMSTGGTSLTLNSRGRFASAESVDVPPLGDDEWVTIGLKVDDGAIDAVAMRRFQQVDRWQGPCEPGGRGFLRFETAVPGFEVRDIRVGEPGFRPQLAGDRLEGWEVNGPTQTGWTVHDGIVRCDGRAGGWLRSLETYDNLILRLEYRLSPRGNSGIYVRAPLEGRVSQNGLEIQLLDDFGFRDQILRRHETGAIYDAVAPDIRVPVPVNKWNAIEIFADGKRVRTALNAVPLYDVRLDDDARDANAQTRPLATRRLTGFIGLQNHGTPVEFQRIRVLPLRPTR